jgi:hypothetical protein
MIRATQISSAVFLIVSQPLSNKRSDKELPVPVATSKVDKTNEKAKTGFPKSRVNFCITAISTKIKASPKQAK